MNTSPSRQKPPPGSPFRAPIPFAYHGYLVTLQALPFSVFTSSMLPFTNTPLCMFCLVFGPLARVPHVVAQDPCRMNVSVHPDFRKHLSCSLSIPDHSQSSPYNPALTAYHFPLDYPLRHDAHESHTYTPCSVSGTWLYCNSFRAEAHAT
jgi:hypothetical protein